MSLSYGMKVVSSQKYEGGIQPTETTQYIPTSNFSENHLHKISEKNELPAPDSYEVELEVYDYSLGCYPSEMPAKILELTNANAHLKRKYQKALGETNNILNANKDLKNSYDKRENLLNQTTNEIERLQEIITRERENPTQHLNPITKKLAQSQLRAANSTIKRQEERLALLSQEIERLTAVNERLEAKMKNPYKTPKKNIPFNKEISTPTKSPTTGAESPTARKKVSPKSAPSGKKSGESSSRKTQRVKRWNSSPKLNKDLSKKLYRIPGI